jgi:hypothetical protein
MRSGWLRRTSQKATERDVFRPCKIRGRAGEIRTLDLFDPNEALYQAEPQPDIDRRMNCEGKK